MRHPSLLVLCALLAGCARRVHSPAETARTAWTHLSNSDSGVCAVRADGTAWCWGNVVGSNSAVQVRPGNHWSALEFGSSSGRTEPWFAGLQQSGALELWQGNDPAQQQTTRGSVEGVWSSVSLKACLKINARSTT